MATKAEKTEKTEKATQRPPVVDDAGIKETFADDFVGLYGVGPNFHLTFATRRPVRTAPGVARFVSSRVVLPLEAAMELYSALHNAVSSLESRGVVKRRQVPTKAEKQE
jgi:hypothetical protein